MKVSAFTYIRNGFNFDYPFLESIKSVLPVVDEFIVVVGDSFDGTRDAVAALNNPKIKIIDTVWDNQLRKDGLIFALQSNIGLDNVSKDADWAFHIQADEVIHEKDYPAITRAMQKNLTNTNVDGLLFNFVNFFGDYSHISTSRRFHLHEIRIVRNNPLVRSYRDSQGFRIFINPKNTLNEKGTKLRVKKVDAAIYHYSYARKPENQFQKTIEFSKAWTADDASLEGWANANKDTYDFTKNIDYLIPFKGTHPNTMQARIARQDWTYNYDPKISNMTFAEKLLRLLEKITGKQFFIYKNYKIIK
jgi:hypothetical protein